MEWGLQPNAKNEEKKKVSGKENKEKLFTASALHAVSTTENSSCVFVIRKITNLKSVLSSWHWMVNRDLIN